MQGQSLSIRAAANAKRTRRSGVVSICVILLLSLSSFADCGEDARPSDVAGQRLQAVHQDQPNPPENQNELESEAGRLCEIAMRHVYFGRLNEAIAVQRQVVSAREAIGGVFDWRTKSEQALLTELDRILSLPLQNQRAYSSAYKKLQSAGMKLGSQNYKGALPPCQEAVDELSSALGENFVAVAMATERLSIICMFTDNPSKARDEALRSAAIWKLVVGDNHPAYANALSLAGSACLQSKEFNQAERMFRDAMGRQRRLFGPASSVYLDSLGKLSRALIDQGRFPEAEAMCLQAIGITEQMQGRNAPSLATFLYNLADVNIAFDEYESAEINMRRSLVLFEKQLPASNAATAATIERYAWLLRRMGRADEAQTIEVNANAGAPIVR